MGLFFNEDINTLFVGGTSVSAIYMGDTQIWPSSGLKPGTIFNFEYTGTVQSVDLPAGKYKLQCWGAQGGNVTGSYSSAGSKGGYSEGILQLDQPKTLYIFVGGKGPDSSSNSSQTDTGAINGGWNGGGCGLATAYYNTEETSGKSFPRPGGGATDICTVSSTMSYSNYRTNRSSASLLSRMIVAGGGAGASASYTYSFYEGYGYSGKSDQSQQGGGIQGKGLFPGTQNAAGAGGGSFGLGANQTKSGFMYCSGGGGGGWYGGGCNHADDYEPTINQSGGGSGFVNIPINASFRPKNYTGLQLESGFTIAGSESHPSINGGTETGHSGNGYARITVVDNNYSGPGESGGGQPVILWTTMTGTWKSGTFYLAKDGKEWISESPGSSGSTVLRCTFKGVSSITFNCSVSAETGYDYLTVGSLDTPCTRSSYNTKVDNTTKDVTFSCSSESHYVEFCYSKDSSVNDGNDNAVVYIKSYS